MSFVSVRVDQEVVDVDNYILEVPEYAFHELLKRGWASQQSHWGSDPVKLSFSWNGESRQWLGFFVQLHLPESGCAIQGQEDT